MTKHSVQKKSPLMKSVAVFGAAQTGKSSLVARFLGKPFEEQHIPTVEDCYSGRIYSGDSLCQFDIIDTSGTFEFPAMERLTMEKADAFIFVYSIDKLESFERVKSCLNRLGEVKNIKSVPVIVVCNKADLDDITMLRELQMKLDNGGLQTVPNEKETVLLFKDNDKLSDQNKTTLNCQRELVLDLGCTFLLTSAKLRWNVNRIFHQLFNVCADDTGTELEKKDSKTINHRFGNKMKLMWRKVHLGGNHS